MPTPRNTTIALAIALALATGHAAAQATNNASSDTGAQTTQTLPTINVKGKKAYDWRKYVKAKLKHQMPEVDGARITVTKKTTVTHLDTQPTVIDNNLQQLLARTPGVVVSQQPTPTQFNLSYRGLGNPQESEYMLVLQDGIPLESDWIGFPTLYAMPLSQSLSEIQLIRGGSSLLYGPEPAPVLNLVSKRPTPGTPFSASTEQVSAATACIPPTTWCRAAPASGPGAPTPATCAATAPVRTRNRRCARPTCTSNTAPTTNSIHGWTSTRSTPIPAIRVASAIRNGRPIRAPRRRRGTATGWIATRSCWDTSKNGAMAGCSSASCGRPTRPRTAAGANGALPPQPPPSSTTLQSEQYRTAGYGLARAQEVGPRQRVHRRRRAVPRQRSVAAVDVLEPVR